MTRSEVPNPLDRLDALLGDFAPPPAPAKKPPAPGLTDKVNAEMRTLLVDQSKALNLSLDDYGKMVIWIGYQTIQGRLQPTLPEQG